MGSCCGSSGCCVHHEAQQGGRTTPQLRRQYVSLPMGEDAPLLTASTEQQEEGQQQGPVAHPLLAALLAALLAVLPIGPHSAAQATLAAPPPATSSSAQAAAPNELSSTAEAASPAAAPAAADLASPGSPYAPIAKEQFVPRPVEVGWEIWVGFAAGVIPFAIGSWEFGKRIIIQRRCALCDGRGLVPSTKAGTKYLRKCPECGGFFPWVSWKMFLTSAAAPGNGGPLQQPRGQTSVLYSVPDAMPTPEQRQAAKQQYLSQGARMRAQPKQQEQEAGGAEASSSADGADK